MQTRYLVLAGLLLTAVGLLMLLKPLGALTNSVNAQGTSSDSWPMAGANPQRTSWVANEVNPAKYNSYGVVWYRPIEAYIGQHFQLVTSRGKVYVATSRGLYALDVTNGNTVWKFDTQLPLGHSPTVVDQTIYFGSFDHRLYALNADTGAVKWQFAGAQAGFSTNPLVVDNTVYAGNRDGYFYALNADSGNLRWQYPKSGEQPLAPILYSAAYQNNTVYFAANDNYAYALDAANGSLKWRSEKLPGEGYQAFWPVVYKDKVIFSGSMNYKFKSPGLESIRNVIPPGSSYRIADTAIGDYINGVQRDDLFGPDMNDGAFLGETFAAGSSADRTGISWPWRNGSEVVDASRVTEYLENDGQIRFDRPDHKPWRRLTIVLNQSDGREYTFDSDGDGHPETAPFVAVGTKSGPQYPPVLMPDKNGNPGELVYKYNFSTNWAHWGIPRKSVMAWHLNSGRYLQVVGADFAIDEPVGLSASGSIIFPTLCCDRVGTWQNTANGSDDEFWGYGHTLESLARNNNPQYWQHSLAPGYDEMWTGFSSWHAMPRRDGGYGSVNGGYHSHGLQNPLVPYQDKLFIHRGNAIIAFGPNPPQAQNSADPTQADYRIYENEIKQLKKRSRLDFNRQSQDSVSMAYSQVKQRLESEIKKMLAAGHLRPGYYTIGQYGFEFILDNYTNPGNTLYTLSIAYPFLSAATQEQLKPYLKQIFDFYFKDATYAHIGWDKAPTGQDRPLQGREYADLAPEVEADIKGSWPSERNWDYPQENFYALWQYTKIFPQDAPTAYQRAKERLNLQTPDRDDLSAYSWEHNAFIAGYYGFLQLQELAGKDQLDVSLRNQVQGKLDNLLGLRVELFDKDNPWSWEEESGIASNKRSMAVARNFLYLTPELAEYLRQHALSQTREAIREYERVTPYWFVGRYEASISEGVMHHLYEIPALFQAKAWILGEPLTELVKYLDVPAFKVGDLFYIQNLVAALGAEGSAGGCPEDVDEDGAVSATDLLAVLRAWGNTAGGRADVSGNGSVEVGDILMILRAWGGCLLAQEGNS